MIAIIGGSSNRSIPWLNDYGWRPAHHDVSRVRLGIEPALIGAMAKRPRIPYVAVGDRILSESHLTSHTWGAAQPSGGAGNWQRTLLFEGEAALAHSGCNVLRKG